MRETRTVEQTRIFYLVLNRVTDRAESWKIVAYAFTRDRLNEWYKDQIAPEPWKDDRFHKVFKKDSPLEWYNPIHDILSQDPETFGHGVFEEWVVEDELAFKSCYQIPE